MVERHPYLTVLAHITIVLGIILMALPIYIGFVASTHNAQALMHAPLPLLPGHDFLRNYQEVLSSGLFATGGEGIANMMLNSFKMAILIAFGKIIVSIFSAYAVVYFHFPFRKLCFWIIFVTLMMPVEVRIVPTFDVVASFNLLNTFTGLSLPLIASATATFLFRQFFLTIPTELVEAARLDGAGPVQFFRDILFPLSKTNIAALFIILFIYGWNQYLWPLVITTDPSMNTIVMGIQKMATVADQIPQWNLIMATAILAMLPPVLIVFLMQGLFEKGLLDREK